MALIFGRQFSKRLGLCLDGEFCLVNQGGGVFRRVGSGDDRKRYFVCHPRSDPCGPELSEGDTGEVLVQEKLEELRSTIECISTTARKVRGSPRCALPRFICLRRRSTWFRRRIFGTFRFSIEIARIGMVRRSDALRTHYYERARILVEDTGLVTSFLEDRKKGCHKTSSVYSEGTARICATALKCRSREHLRLVYGPEYDLRRRERSWRPGTR